jgi:predicted MFS family arabinose efflux permease
LGDIRRLLPALVIGVMGSTGIYLVPLLLGAMVTDRGFSEQQAGWMASLDLAGYATTTLLTAGLLGRCSWRVMAAVGLGLMLVANVATTFAFDPTSFGVARICSGFGAGILAAIANVSLGQSREPDRGYGLLLSGSLLFGTVGLWSLPSLLERYGLNAAYWLIAAFTVLVMAAVRGLPAQGLPESQRETRRSAGVHWVVAGIVLLSVCVFWTEQNAVYAYLERIGSASGLEPSYIGFSLGLANLTGFVGAALVAWLGSRFGRLGPLAIATLVQLGCLWALAGHVGASAYVVATGAIALAWNVANPIQLGMLAVVDTDGRALAMAATVIGAGLALGPAVGASVVANGDYGRLLGVAAGLAALSFVLMLPALRKRGAPDGLETVSRSA